MGLIYANIKLTRSDDLALYRAGYLKQDQIKHLQVRALVDSGAYLLTINQQVKEQLDLPTLDEQEAELADGSIVQLDIVGPVDIQFENRTTTVRAMVLPQASEVLLGVIPMEDLDVLIDPKLQQLVVNPESPYIARKHLK